jgi:hypothetical protein
VYEFRAYSPGMLPAEALDSAMLAPPAPAAVADEACLLREVVPLLTQADDGAGAVLRVDAAQQPRGAAERHLARATGGSAGASTQAGDHAGAKARDGRPDYAFAGGTASGGAAAPDRRTQTRYVVCVSNSL